jgi:hypothetical protein
VRIVVLVALVPLCAGAQSNDAAIQRALIERDRQSAEFSRPELRHLHTQQDLNPRPMRIDERALQARERDAYPRAEPVSPGTASPGPLPLPGGPAHGVDPVPVQGVSH